MNLADLIKKNHNPAKVVIPKAGDDDVLLMVSEALQHGIADFILLDNPAKIKKVAQECGANITQAEIIEDNGEEAEVCNHASRLIFEKKAEVLMKGLVQTSTFMKAILNKEFGFVPSGTLLSHVGVFSLPHYEQLIIVTDPAINIAPTLEEKVKIIENALKISYALGAARPKVALVSAVEKVNPKIQSTVDAAELKKMSLEGKFGNAILDGPFGLDVAMSKTAAQIKGIQSEVAGNPDILLLPNLDAGNVLYKSLTYIAEAMPASIVAGAKIPIVLTSRADSEKTKLYSLGLASYLAQS